MTLINKYMMLRRNSNETKDCFLWIVRMSGLYVNMIDIRIKEIQLTLYWSLLTTDKSEDAQWHNEDGHHKVCDGQGHEEVVGYVLQAPFPGDGKADEDVTGCGPEDERQGQKPPPVISRLLISRNLADIGPASPLLSGPIGPLLPAPLPSTPIGHWDQSASLHYYNYSTPTGWPHPLATRHIFRTLHSAHFFFFVMLNSSHFAPLEG